MNYLSKNTAVLAAAAEFAARVFSVRGDFSRDAECGNDECGFEGEMEFKENGSETAVAECPECGDTVEIYTTD